MPSSPRGVTVSVPPGAVPFARVTPADVAACDEVHVSDPRDPGYRRVLRVGRPVPPGDTLRLLLVTFDTGYRDAQLVLLGAMVLAARSAARGSIPGR